MKNTIIKRIFSILLGTTILTTTILAASLPQMTASVYAANPEVTLGSDTLKTNAGQTGAQKVLYGGRSWVVIAYKGKDGSGTDIKYHSEVSVTDVSLYAADTITLLQENVTETSNFNHGADTSNYNAYGYYDFESNTPSDFRKFIEQKYLTGSTPYINAKEQSMIVPRTLEGDGSNYGDNGYDSNKMKGHEVTGAKVWPLSVAEAKKLNRTGILKSDQNVSDLYWLRSPSDQDITPAHVTYYGIVSQTWPSQPIRDAGCRPALHLNPSAIILTLKTDDGYRLVAKDDDITVSVKPSVITKEGTTVSVPYRVTGDHDKAYILITDKAYDADGAEIKLYTELTDAGNGKGSFTLPDSFDTSWKAYIVAEDTSAGSIHADFAGISSAFTIPDPLKVATPTFDPEEGTYTEAQNVEISCDTEGARIYYTTNGDEPTTSSIKYTSAISVTETTTIKAIAVKDGMTDSGVAIGKYTISADPIKVTGVSLSQTEMTLKPEATRKLTATVEPEDATDKDVTWKSDDESIAKVSDDGTVTAVAEGETTITVTTKDGNKTATCKVIVKKDAPETCTITFDANGGEGSMDDQTVDKGTSTKLRKNKFTRDGYAFDGWNTQADGKGKSYKDKDEITVEEDTTLFAQWKEGKPEDDDDDDDHHSDHTPPSWVLNPNEKQQLVIIFTGTPAGLTAGYQEQGEAAQALFKKETPAGWQKAFSFNILKDAKADYSLKQGTLTLIIPTEYRKAGRQFAILAMGKNGQVIFLPDTDTDPNTITVALNIEGYAFELIYKD